jgi:hypothetical protein
MSMTLPLADDKPITRPLPPYHVEVKFGSAIGNDAQGRALLMLEKYMRLTLGEPAEIYKETMPDDLKRRRDMTPEQRENL